MMDNSNKRGTPKSGKSSLACLAAKNSVSPVLRDVGQLAAGVASVSTVTGSATGNPRNKCALEPGHSLMDWIRLGSSGKDLTGVGPQKAGKMTVTSRELANHATPTDAWLSINGKVYNVTSYLPFHPGGADELMKGAGRDATALFNQVHPYVNFEQMLQKCLIGRIRSDVDDPAALFDGVDLPPPTCSPLLSLKKEEIKDERPSSTSPALMPRFNWIQTLKNVTLTFYTAPFSNPFVETYFTDSTSNKIMVALTYRHVTYENEILLDGNIQSVWTIKVTLETGKVDLILMKSEVKIWENYGVLRQTCRDSSSNGGGKLEYRVASKSNVNYNTFLVELKRADGSKCVIPVGKHVRVFGDVSGVPTARSYTPVPRTPLKIDRNSSTDDVWLLIKRYPQGNVSSMVCDLRPGSLVTISRPLGDFDLLKLDKREIFVMLAAGTGITPMLGLIDFLLERRIRKCQRLLLLFFNRTRADILLFEQLERLHRDDVRFRVHHILSNSDSDWSGLKGHVSAQLLQQMTSDFIKDTTYSDADLYFLVCGSDKFSDLSKNLLKNCGYQDDQFHLFCG